MTTVKFHFNLGDDDLDKKRLFTRLSFTSFIVYLEKLWLSLHLHFSSCFVYFQLPTESDTCFFAVKSKSNQFHDKK